MTRFFVSVAILSVFVTGVLAGISCFYGETVQYGKGSPVGNLQSGYCPTSNYCLKIASYQSNLNSFQYYCSDYRCQSNGCQNMGNGIKQCCCSKNLCNGSRELSKTAVLSIVLAVLSAVFALH